MSDVKEVYEMVTKQKPPQPDALERQWDRQRRAARNRRFGAFGVAAALIALLIGAFVFAQARAQETTPATNTPTPLTFPGFVSSGATRQTAAIVDTTGRQTGTLPGLPADAYSLSVSADGRTIAFIAAGSDDRDHIGVMNADGSGVRTIPTPNVEVVAHDLAEVAISPDGSELAFAGLGDPSSNADIYVIGVDGSGLTRLTDDPATDENPQWSPDGTTIIYENGGRREDPNGGAQFSPTSAIWTVAADGRTQPTRLTGTGLRDSMPSFSPDGSQVAFFHDGQLWVMGADGSHARELVDAGGSGAFTPRWSPDGKQIAFANFSGRGRNVQDGTSFANMGLDLVALANASTGKVTELPDVAMVSFFTAPQWIDNGRLLILTVPAHGAEPSFHPTKAK